MHRTILQVKRGVISKYIKALLYTEIKFIASFIGNAESIKGSTMIRVINMIPNGGRNAFNAFTLFVDP